MTEVPEDWVTGVLELCDDEAIALWAAIESGFLLCSHPTDLLVRTYHLLCVLEVRICVVVIPRPGLIWKIAVSVPELAWLPCAIRRLNESGACIQRVIADSGVVSGLLPSGSAESVAKTLLDVWVAC